MKLRPIHILTGLIAIIVSSYCIYNFPYIGNVPFTLQSLIVFVVASILKPKEFLICILVYLALGIVGAPVYAAGASGFEKLIGNSGGFLYGFIFSGYYISSSFKEGETKSFIGILNVMIQATVVLFFFGLLHLTIIHGFNNALVYGLYPFWTPALLKIFIATVMIYLISRYQRA